jgi:hypothetical protein
MISNNTTSVNIILWSEAFELEWKRNITDTGLERSKEEEIFFTNSTRERS